MKNKNVYKFYAGEQTQRRPLNIYMNLKKRLNSKGCIPQLRIVGPLNKIQNILLNIIWTNLETFALSQLFLMLELIKVSMKHSE